MKDHRIQTPQKEYPRHADLANRRSKDSLLKKPPTNSKKCLNGAFTSVAVDSPSDISMDSSDFSPASEILDSNPSSQMTDNSVSVLHPTLSASPETYALSNLTPNAKIATVVEEYGSLSMMNLLERAQTQVWNSADVDSRSKKLNMESLVATDGYYGLPEEKDWVTEIVSMKARVALCSFFFWSLAVAMAFLCMGFGGHSSYRGPPPT